ncbi:hypothetical protein NPIL_651361, partial [Nephila pilipes]
VRLISAERCKCSALLLDVIKTDRELNAWNNVFIIYSARKIFLRTFLQDLVKIRCLARTQYLPPENFGSGAPFSVS